MMMLLIPREILFNIDCAISVSQQCKTKVLSLAQDPAFSKVTSTRDVLHTIIRNAHILWVESFQRWMTSREALLAQGFPVTNEALQWSQDGAPDILPLCSFNSSRLQSNFHSRSRVQMMHQAGNAMCVQVVGSVMLFSLLHAQPVHNIVIPRALSFVDESDSSSQPSHSTRAKSSRHALINLWSAWRSPSSDLSAGDSRQSNSVACSRSGSSEAICDSPGGAASDLSCGTPLAANAFNSNSLKQFYAFRRQRQGSLGVMPHPRGQGS